MRVELAGVRVCGSAGVRERMMNESAECVLSECGWGFQEKGTEEEGYKGG